MTVNRRTWLAGSAASVAWLAGGIPVPAWAQGAGKALNIAMFPEPNAVVAGAGSNGPALMVTGNIYDGLVRYDDKLEPQPNLATSWTVSPDALVYTFKLKRGVTFHDGKPCTAADVVFSADKFMRVFNPMLRVRLEAVKSIRALDDYSVEFQLNHPVGGFMTMFDSNSLPIVPRHQFENTDFATKPPSGNPNGTGPYKFKEWVRGSHIQLVKNDAYHEAGLPKVENVYFHVIPDAVSRASAFESGKIDVLPGGTVEYFDVARLAKLPGVAVTTKGWEKFAPLSWLWINHRNPLLADLRVRQAVSYALNREAMSKVIWQGYATPATGPLNHNTAFYTDKVKAYPHDPARARKLLAEAGYKGETIRLLGLPYGESWARMGEMAKQNLTEAGFKIELVSTDVAGMMARQSSWDFDLAFTYLYQHGDPAGSVARSYISSEIKKGSAFNNLSGYANPKVDSLFASGALESDRKKRGEIYAEVQRILVDDAVEAWLLELNFPTVYRTRIENLINTGMGLNDSLARASIK